MTIEELKYMRESEDHVEFKEAKTGVDFNGGSHTDPKRRRKCVLGYVVALANEGGGHLVLGMDDSYPHKVVGSSYVKNELGVMEDAIYQHLRIRVHTKELFEEGRRVVVFKVPGRPLGMALKFEGVPLMRTGDGLRDMSDGMLRDILNEQEPDFSAKVCPGLTVADLDPGAVAIMQQAYAKKQGNPAFASLTPKQALSDLDLFKDGQLTNAALILLGREEVIRERLPQCRVIREFRVDGAQIHFDQREEFEGPLFKMVDLVWNAINDPRLNRMIPVQEGAYFFNIPTLNEVVIREALLNALAHRDYTTQSEVVIKQYPDRIIILNPGGFPKGVTLENLLTVNSTPRSRLMAEVMAKTGLVERSGQGVDKIYSITLSEGKAEPDYTGSDAFQVTLSLCTPIVDRAFHVFVSSYQRSGKDPKLGVEHIITLGKVRQGLHQNLKPNVVEQLVTMGLLTKTHHSAKRYRLANIYHQLADDEQRIGKRYLTTEVTAVALALQEGALKIGELEQGLDEMFTRSQLRTLLQRLAEDGIIDVTGKLKGTRYGLIPDFGDLRGEVLINAVLAQLRTVHG